MSSLIRSPEREEKDIGGSTPFEDSGRATQVIIVVLHYGDVQDTLRCLDSLERLQLVSHQIVVVDNGSIPSANPEIGRRYCHVHVIRRETNGGWAGGNNTGIRYA